MKALSDLLSTDYGVMSLIVLAVIIAAMLAVTVFVIRESKKS